MARASDSPVSVLVFINERDPPPPHTSHTLCLELMLLLAAVRFSKVVSPLDADGVFLSPISINIQISRTAFGAIFNQQHCECGHGVSWARREGTVQERRGAAKPNTFFFSPRSCWTDSLLTACGTVWKRIGTEGVEQIRSPFTRRRRRLLNGRKRGIREKKKRRKVLEQHRGCEQLNRKAGKEGSSGVRCLEAAHAWSCFLLGFQGSVCGGS